jgi:hypothetical protein
VNERLARKIAEAVRDDIENYPRRDRHGHVRSYGPFEKVSEEALEAWTKVVADILTAELESA